MLVYTKQQSGSAERHFFLSFFLPSFAIEFRLFFPQDVFPNERGTRLKKKKKKKANLNREASSIIQPQPVSGNFLRLFLLLSRSPPVAHQI